MRSVRSQIDIAAPAELVWRLVSEFRYWPLWGPTVRSVTSEASAVEKGVTGQVETPLGVRLPFVITEAEPPRTWSWKVGGVTATGHEIESLGPSATRVEFTAPWAFFPYVVVLRIGLRRLKRLAESHQ